MKKAITMIMAMVLAVLSFATITSAATTADIIQKLTDSSILNASYVAQAESYLNSVTITSEQADQIIAHIDAVNEIVGDKTKLSELSLDMKQEILNEFTQAGVVMNLTVVSASGNITITDSQDRSIFKVDFKKDNLIKQTGFDYSIIIAGLSLVLIAIAGAFVSRKVLASRN